MIKIILQYHLQVPKNNLTSAGNIPTHTHNYSKATCTEPATCYCGATSGSKLGHSYNGESCSRCGVKNPNYVKTYSLGETKNHTWNGGTVTKQASCKENGAAIEKPEKNNTAVYIIIAVCAVVLIGGIAAVVIVKKKKA